MSAMAPPEDSKLPRLRHLLDRLFEGTQRWSKGLAADGGDRGLADLRHRALLLNHARYAELVPVYRRLAEEEGLLEVPDLDTLVNGLMFTDEVFKSYDPQWLADGAFDEMTRWLRGRSTYVPDVETRDVHDLREWRLRLRAEGVFLSLSSGTSGRLSFVPRDRATLETMIRNGSGYYHPVWEPLMDGSYGAFDALILGYRGKGLGLQAAGEGLARMAAHSHFLFDAELTPDAVWRLSAAGGAVPQALDEAYARSAEFLQSGAALGRKVLVFGTPFQVRELCAWVRSGPGRLPLAPGSLVISGGGWKRFDGRRIARGELLQEVADRLDVPASHAIDTFSTAELNCVFMTCAEGRFHIPPMVEPVVLDASLQSAVGREGTGTLGVLDPFAASYPGFIITGDQVTLVRDPCACGLTGWSILGEIQRAPGRPVKGCAGVMAATTA